MLFTAARKSVPKEYRPVRTAHGIIAVRFAAICFAAAGRFTCELPGCGLLRINHCRMKSASDSAIRK